MECFKFLWVISLMGIIFFSFIAIQLKRQPQFFTFRPSRDNQTIISCWLIVMVYAIIFTLSTFWMWKSSQPKIDSDEATNYSDFIDQSPDHNLQDLGQPNIQSPAYVRQLPAV